MNEVEPRFKQNQGECGCGCGVYGTLKKPWRDQTRCVARKCRCKRCTGLRSRRGGQRSQADAAKAMGMPNSSLRPGHEEFMAWAFRWEHKGGYYDAGPVITKFLASRDQSEASRPIGDHRPFVATFTRDRVRVMAFDINDLPEVVAAVAEEWEKSA